MKKLHMDKGWLKFQYVALGRSPEDIAKECGINIVDIFRQLRDFDLLRKRETIRELGKLPKYQDKDWLYNQYVNLRRTSKDMAKECNVGAHTILRWLKIFNIKIRGSHGGMWTDKKWLMHQYCDLKETAREIAEMSGTTMSTICRWLKIHDIEIRRYGWQKRNLPIMGKYTDEKWLRHQYLGLRKSQPKIAKELGFSSSTISNWLTKFKIPTRTPSEQKLKGDEKYTNEKWLRKQYQDLSRPLYKIAEESNISVATLHKWAKKFGIKREEKFRPTIEKQIYMDETWLYTQYWEHGKTMEQIAKECNVTAGTILKFLNRYNIPTRHWSEYKRPSGLERQFIQFIKENKLPFRYVGTDASEKLDISQFPDVSWKIIYPDFKHETKKVAIEIGDKRHKARMGKKKYGSWEEYEKMRKKAYEILGWKPIIVWEDEFVKNPNRVLKEIQNIINVI